LGIALGASCCIIVAIALFHSSRLGNTNVKDEQAIRALL